jgi:hypothetical protein
MDMHWNAREFRDFARALRTLSPELQRRLRHDLRETSHVITSELKLRLPHQTHAAAAQSGVRYSDALMTRGAAIIIGGTSPPQSWAFAFLYGNRGKGYYKHKVYGRWSSSPNTIMATGSALDETFAKLGPEVVMRVEASIEGILTEVAWGAHA